MLIEFYILTVNMERKKKKTWLPADMKQALEAYAGGNTSIAAASRKFKIPRMTLSDRILGKVAIDSMVGHPRALSVSEESAIVNYINYMYERRFPVDRNQVIQLAWAIDLKKDREDRVFGENGPSLHWWRGFRDRHKDLSLRRSEPIDKPKIQNSRSDVITGYFDLLNEILRSNGLKNSPHLIYNCDESAIVLNKSAQKVIVPRKSKHTRSLTHATSQHVSVLCCVNAAGTTVPPLMVFQRGLPAGRSYQREGPPNTHYCHSDSGFVDQKIYTQWFRKLFLRFASNERPLLLLQDSASAHISPELIDCAIDNDVILMCFPPNLTHLLQPCDVGLYRSMKANLSTTMRQLKLLRGDLWISKAKIPAVFREVFEKTFRPDLITEAFRKCGIYPFARDTLSVDLIQSSPQSTPITSQTGDDNVGHEKTTQNETQIVEEVDQVVTQTSPTTQDTVSSPGTSAGSPILTGDSDAPQPTPVHSAGVLADITVDIISSEQIPEGAEVILEGSATSDTNVCPPQLALAAIEKTLTPRKLKRFKEKAAYHEQSSSGPADPVFSTWYFLTQQVHDGSGTLPQQNSKGKEDHPLVKSGLIPMRLADVFCTPPEDVHDQPRYRLPKAKVLTSDEIANDIRDRDAKRKRLIEEREDRKRVRLEKKARLENEKREKKTGKKKNTSRRKQIPQTRKSLPFTPQQLHGMDQRNRVFSHLFITMNSCQSYRALDQILPEELPYEVDLEPPSQDLINSLNNSDAIAEELLKSSFPSRNVQSWSVQADGNCLPRAGSIFLCGNEEKHIEIRVRLVHELVKHSDLYLSDAFLNRGAFDAISPQPHTALKYAQYSPDYIPGTALGPHDIRELYQREVLGVMKKGAYCGIWQLHGLSSVLKARIQSFYPGLGPPRNDLSRMILPRSQTAHDALNILWTSTHNSEVATWWSPNHFVPLFPKIRPSSPCQYQPVSYWFSMTWTSYLWLNAKQTQFHC